jgi:hypothetical protein
VPSRGLFRPARYRQGVHGKQETEWSGHEKERQEIPQLTAEVPSLEGSFMVLLPVKSVEPPVKKAAVVDVAMKKKFDQAPNWDARQIKHDPEQRMPAPRHEWHHVSE